MKSRTELQHSIFFRKPILTTKQSDIPLNVLFDYMQNIEYSGLDILVALSKITNTSFEDKEKEMIFLPATMAMMAVIVTKNLAGDINNLEGIPDKLINKILQMSARTDGYSISEILIPLDKIRILCKVFGLQVALQGELLCRIVRYACIIGLAGLRFHGLNEIPDDELGEINSNNILHIFAFLFLIYSTISRGITFTKADLKSYTTNSTILNELIDDMLEILSCTKSDVKEHITTSRKKQIVGFSIPFDLFCRKPLFQLPNNRYLRMPAVFSRAAASQYLFFTRRQNLRKDGSKQAEESLNLLGSRFEKYAYHLISACLPGYSAYPEIRIQTSGGEYRTPDGIYSNGFGRDVILMQAKLKPPTSGLLLGELGISYRLNDLRSTYSEMFCQSIKFLVRLKYFFGMNMLDGLALEIAEHVLGAKSIRLFSLCPTIPPIFHWGSGKDILWEVAARKLSDEAPEALSWFNELKNSGVVHDCLLLSDPEPFELFSIKKNDSIITEDIDLWWTGIQNTPEDYHGLPIDLREYIRIKYGSDPNLPDSFMVAGYERLFERVSEVLED